jgi:hypothetical protein
MRSNPSDKKSQKTRKSLLTFGDGDAGMWCNWQEQLDELYWLLLLTAAKQRAKPVMLLLCANSLALYTSHYILLTNLGLNVNKMNYEQKAIA